MDLLSGGKHDKNIVRELLQKMLATGEMIETDAGYGAVGLCVVTDGFVRSRDDFLTAEEKRRDPNYEQDMKHVTVPSNPRPFSSNNSGMTARSTGMSSMLLLC